VLKEAGLVLDRPVGNRRIYQLNPEGIEALHAYLDQFWKRSLAAFKAVAEQTTQEAK
jgi:DNA-binding transcriptional ArsR family regulator